ncbi:MAG: DUF502 domain-containing protein [Pacificimonas sp.]
MAEDPDARPPRSRWRDISDSFFGTFLTGLLFLLPFIVTLMILDWVIRQVAGLFGTDTILGSAITEGSALLFGENNFGILVLLAIIMAAIWLVGRLFQTRAKRTFQDRIDGWMEKIPLIGGIYRPISHLTRMLGSHDKTELESMSPIAVRFGNEDPAKAADVLALLANPKPVHVGGQPRMLVYMPSAPLPMTGFLFLVPAENVVPVEGVAVEDLVKFYISIGTAAPSALKMGAPVDLKEIAHDEAARDAAIARASKID